MSKYINCELHNTYWCDGKNLYLCYACKVGSTGIPVVSYSVTKDFACQ